MLADAQGRNDALRALLACVLLAPSPPMLFMGEEYAASTPFLYFCDFEGELAQAVTNGRRNEFSRFARFSDPTRRDLIPDPNAESTFLKSKLDWAERDQVGHAEWLALYRNLIGLRHQHLVPRLANARSGRLELPAPGCVQVQWPLGDRARWHLLANLSSTPAGVSRVLPGEPVYASHPSTSELAPWSVRVQLEIT
jgi:maltooligosyltrehalose trehalohydrolase